MLNHKAFKAALLTTTALVDPAHLRHALRVPIADAPKEKKP